jgi:hypothetical protein
MKKFAVLAGILLGFSIAGNAQTRYATVLGNIGPQDAVCSQGGAGSKEAGCKAKWASSDGSTAEVLLGALNDYGQVTAGALSQENCMTVCSFSSSANPAEAYIYDQATLENAPSSDAYFLIQTVKKGISTFPPLTFTNFTVSLADNQSHQESCNLGTPTGRCWVYIPVTGNPDQVFTFELSLKAASVIAPGAVGQPTRTAYANVTVTELAVVNSKGQVLSNVVIHTKSGHQYPE